ncbi:glutathione S-transferase family protein [Candidatus Paraluminiphilus aquimaris]|uniref:Glutathione S-transferase family protein n=1 Tax=Candidatus Paraluminiphilus aquimaris TaxID=2518994 RepID=A0ABY6Q9M6_9GAMM|nr:glutathione S-transferase family protein [Candidatus Paraluminiphilus aquimaris]UZP75329.1 glutathione S-transferase family protein [Candidatus Paraluminiphilus aquimaris]
MILYSGDLSPYSAKVRMQIYAMGVSDDFSFELPVVQFFSGKLKEVSPIGRIPILKTDEGLIPESEVIAEYIDELYPQQSLVGNTPIERANIRVLSRIADTYLMDNIFLALGQMRVPEPNQAIIDLLTAQVVRGVTALEEYLTADGYAAGGSELTRADCSLVPALYMCDRTLPRLGISNPVLGLVKTEAYWGRIQQNEHAARVIAEMDRGLKARLDGSEQRMVAEAMKQAAARSGS